MKKDNALLVAGLVFFIVAAIHALRYFLDVEIVVAGHVLSQTVSIVGFVVTFVLGLWMFMARRGNGR